MVERVKKDCKIDGKSNYLEAQKCSYQITSTTVDELGIDSIRLSNSITRDHRMVLAIISAGKQVLCKERKEKSRCKFERIFQKFKFSGNQRSFDEDLAKDLNPFELINSCPLIKGENNGMRRLSMAERWKNDRLLVYHACKNYIQFEMLSEL